MTFYYNHLGACPRTGTWAYRLIILPIILFFDSEEREINGCKIKRDA
jgi:hypothetical protein